MMNQQYLEHSAFSDHAVIHYCCLLRVMIDTKVN